MSATSSSSSPPSKMEQMKRNQMVQPNVLKRLFFCKMVEKKTDEEKSNPYHIPKCGLPTNVADFM